jgi:uncharacterized protein YbjT (DUF2867 family)
MNTPSTPGTTTLVVGATGTTGSRVVALLTANGHRVRAATRNAAAHPVGAAIADAPQTPTPQTPQAEAVRFDWTDPATHDAALRGTALLYLVPPPGHPDPAEVMLPFLQRARAAGVRRVGLLSASAIPAGGPAVGQVHQALAGLFEEWAVLRPSWFMQNFTGDHVHAETIRANGTILTATGRGRVGFVDADDISAVAVHALTATRPPNTDLIITGPQALGYDDVAAILTEVTGRTVTHRQLTHEQLRDRLAATMPRDFAALLAGLDLAIAEGTEDRTTDTVQRLTGRAPRSFREFAERELSR